MSQPRSNENEKKLLTPNNSRGSIHHPKTLPTEIWSEIFSLVFSIDSYDSPGRSRVLDMNIYPNISVARLIQAKRLNYLRICKSLLPLAEQWFFVDVAVKGSRQFDGFMTQSTTMSANNRTRGEWTKNLRVHTDRSNPLTIDLSIINSTYPNLQLLELGRNVDVILGTQALLGDWRTALRNLSIADLTWEALGQISIHCPQLTHLTIMDCHGRNGEQDPINFPNLRHFSACAYFANEYDLSKLILPSLETAKVDDDGAIGWEAFYERHGGKIKELEIVPNEELVDASEFPLTFGTFFNTYVSLEKLTFVADMFRRASDGHLETLNPHASLSHLQIVTNEIRDGSPLEQHAECFTPEMFPGLRRVTIILRVSKKYQEEELMEYLESLFPDVVVDIY